MGENTSFAKEKEKNLRTKKRKKGGFSAQDSAVPDVIAYWVCFLKKKRTTKPKKVETKPKKTFSKRGKGNLGGGVFWWGGEKKKTQGVLTTPQQHTGAKVGGRQLPSSSGARAKCRNG